MNPLRDGVFLHVENKIKGISNKTSSTNQMWTFESFKDCHWTFLSK